MTQLSVNINKIATLRNARGRNVPDLIKCAVDIEKYGAHGITVHPRPDERHIRYSDVLELKKALSIELNVEGNPKEKKFMDLVLKIKPTQVTLVPDANNQLTSNHGWDTIKHANFLKEIITELKNNNIRSSIFVNPEPRFIEPAAAIGVNRIELYTEPFAKNYSINKTQAIQPFFETAKEAERFNIGVNAGHDLSLDNLQFFKKNIPNLLEVSIGHALISDALYFGLENTVQMYLRQLQ